MTRRLTLTGRCAAAVLSLAGLMTAPAALSQTGSRLGLAPLAPVPRRRSASRR